MLRLAFEIYHVNLFALMPECVMDTRRKWNFEFLTIFVQIKSLVAWIFSLGHFNLDAS